MVWRPLAANGRGWRAVHMGAVPESGLTVLLLITIVIGSNPAPRKSAPHRLPILTTLCFCLDCSSPCNSSDSLIAPAAFCSSPEGPSALNRLSWRRASGRHARLQPPPYRDCNPARNGTVHRHQGRAGCNAGRNIGVHPRGGSEVASGICAEPLIPPGNDGRAYPSGCVACVLSRTGRTRETMRLLAPDRTTAA